MNNTMPAFPVMLTVTQMEQSLYTLEMCITTLMQNIMDNPIKSTDESQSQNMVYTELMETSTQLRNKLNDLNVELEPPLYQMYMADEQQQMRLHA